MNNFQIRAFVRELISEAKKAKKDDKKPAKKADKKDDKKEPKLPKSSGKLMDLKKEVAYLKEMASQLQATGLTEGEEQVVEVEFANLQKFVNELSKVKMEAAGLKKKLEEEITSLEEKMIAEKNKIKEMIGLISEEELEEARFKKEDNKIKSILNKIGDIEEKIYDQYGDDEIEAKFDYGKAIDDIKSKYKNDEAQMYKALESHLEKLKKSFPLKETRFKKGTDIGKPGKGFKKIAKSAAKRYGSEKAGKNVAGAILKKVVAKK